LATGSLPGGRASLGGQLGALFASLHLQAFEGLVLVASGSPYWRRFHHGRLISLAYRAAPLLARWGWATLPARAAVGLCRQRSPWGVIADWARSGLSGRYAAQGMAVTLEGRFGALAIPALTR